jgi:hypothetical protein
LSKTDGALEFKLHDAQLEIYEHPARFKVVAAGRRFGKTYLARVLLAINALKSYNEEGFDLSDEEVYYIAPTFEQGKKIMWNALKSLLKMESEGGLIRAAHENTAVITLINGRRISIKGADRPDTLRGVGLSFAVMDEYAFMKGDVWELIIQPALSRSKGGALFIGTPDGKNHFFDLYQKAQTRPVGFEDWYAWTFESLANTTLDPKEISRQISTMSVAAARQEFGASFNSGGGAHLREEWWKRSGEPEGDYYIAVDLNGFSSGGSIKKGALKIKDDTAIAVVKASTDGWWVENIITGQWDVRRTALEIVKAYADYKPVKLGIERGVLYNAVAPYLEDEMKRLNRYFVVWDLKHGSQHKEDRIRWALQGRLEKGRLKLNEHEEYDENGVIWQRKLIEQANDFPSPLSHDDMLDALSYTDQLADTVYYEGGVGTTDDWAPLDLVAGF